MMKPTIDPIVIKPEGFDVKAAWAECNQEVKDRGGMVTDDGEVNWGAAFSADPGCVSCPNCNQSYWAWGQVIKCSECEFVFPTYWWHEFRSGVSDAKRERSTAHTPIKRRHPYYAYGCDHPEAVKSSIVEREDVDWKSVIGDCDYVSDRFEILKICDRCGAVKEPGRQRSTKPCASCEANSKCRHYHPSAPMSHDGCKLGIDLDVLVGSEKMGWRCRLPCSLGSYSHHVIPCSKFEPYTVQEIQADDLEFEEAMARFMLAGPLLRKIKAEHKGTNWSGVVECPSCNGRLHLSHAKCNGHIWGKCETEGCLSWIE